MRVDVKKFLFLGVQGLQRPFFEQMQRLGVVEFFHAKRGQALQDPHVQELLMAIKILRGLPLLEQTERSDWESATALAGEIITLHHEIQKLHEEERLLQLERERVAAFGAFSMEELQKIERDSGYRFYFFSAQENRFPEPPNPALIAVGAHHGLDHYVALTKEPIHVEGLFELRFAKPEQEVEAELALKSAVREEKEGALKRMQTFKNYLHNALFYLLNHVHLLQAQEEVQLPLEGKLFAIEGWVPKTKIAEVQALSLQSDVLCYEVKVADESPPTYLENQGMGQIGQDLVGIYDTPSLTDRDPSHWVLWAFLLFFAIIINDAGYGLLFLIAALSWRLFKPPRTEGAQRILKLSIMLSAACIVWGALTGAYFGIELEPSNPLRTFSLIDWLAEQKVNYHLTHQDQTFTDWVRSDPQLKNATTAAQILHAKGMMESLITTILFEFALIIGTLHVVLSMWRNLRRQWAGFGWVLFMCGLYLYVPFYLQTVSLVNILLHLTPEQLAPVSIQLVWTGLGVAIFLALIQHRLYGALEIMNVVQILRDVLSYMRLYALGLAAMMMASTFNMIALDSGPFFGALILLAGHTINMAMGIMGGVIHGLRLNFLEWYHYSFEGGGRELKPLKWLEFSQAKR